MRGVYKKIENIQFSLLSPGEVKKQASAKVVTAELYDREGYPVEGGLMDTRLGVIDPGLRCRSCNGKLKECQGHFGYIELARPVIHIKYLKIITLFLNSTCSDCGRILIPEEDVLSYTHKYEKFMQTNKHRSASLLSKLIRKDAKGVKKCPHCKAKQTIVKIEKPSTFMEDTKRLSPIEVKARLEKVSDIDCALLGVNPKYARPEWTILSLFAIPPVTMRPSITLESGERSEDDLTHKLGDIVRINQRLFENINAGAPEIIIEDLWDLLQYHVTTFYDNSIAQVPPARHRSGQPLKTITERIKSKEGRFRHNLAGKRVNYSARTVISGDPKIAYNEVGVPVEVCMELSVPERVTEWNKEWLIKFIKNGPKKYPGANYVIVEHGKKKRITGETEEVILEELQVGHVVERHLINGDVCIFNRQPSLHRMSIMCHRIQVLPGKSFRLNPAVCNPYNADFDGDEMNMHIPQTEEARAEAEILMDVGTQIIGPKDGLNVIGCIEDSITGNFLLTKNKIKIPKDKAVQLLISVGAQNTAKMAKFKKEVTGKEIFSVLFPDDFNFVGFAKGCKKCKDCKKRKCENDAYVCIEKGNLVSGTIDKGTIGESNGTLLRDIRRLNDEETTLNYYGLIFNLGLSYLTMRGFTTGAFDADIPENVMAKAKKIIKDSMAGVDETISTYKAGKLKAFSSKTIEETLELMILQKLNEARNKIGEMVSKSASQTNNMIIMANSGAKGNILNLAQTGVIVGQQALRGKRIERGYKNRTLSLFEENNRSAEARGFVRHSYKQGLNPVEYFFHAMTGRDSLMDTALRTPKSGYLYRRLANALQDLKIEYDNTVRDANRTIVQFSYGDDNIDVSKSEGGTIDVKKIITEVQEGA